MTRLSLDSFATIPRVTGLVLSPDGRRLVLTVQTLSPDATRFVSSLWEVATDGCSGPHRLTLSESGESDPAFLPDGSLVFCSARPDPLRDRAEPAEAEGRLWLLPATGGEARPLLSVPGGTRGVTAARGTDTVAVRVLLFPGVDGIDGDAAKAKRRREAGVSGILYDTFPIRWWDHELGPRWCRLLRLRGVSGPEPVQAEDLTPDATDELEPGAYAEEHAFSLSPDGETVVAVWSRPLGKGHRRAELAVIRDRSRRAIAAGDLELAHPEVSPDGLRVAALACDEGNPDRAQTVGLWVGDLASGEGQLVARDLDLRTGEPSWAPDSSAVYFTADEEMQRPIFRWDVTCGRVIRLTESGAFHSICPAPAGVVYALRTSWSSPLEAVRVGPDGTVTPLPTPGIPVELTSTVVPVHTAADDGTPLSGWLVLPEAASAERPAPVVLWIHGGPLSSWNAWNWRWCPHLLAERGYAVVLPDPALSTGHGHALIRRAWGTWGDRVMSDLFSVLDSVLRRPDLDASRTAAMGGSFGGYMANWIAGHSDRFAAIVTHAGLWSLEQFHGTTDSANSWEHEIGSPQADPDRHAAASPDRWAASIHTPMLVIHGLRDHRVPISEALRLWLTLRRQEVPSQFLYFPDENHWVLRPGNTRLWYETMLAFLDHHVLGQPLRRPDLL